MNKIKKIAKKYKLKIIEDAAQAFGAKYNGKNAGTFGLAAAFSFYPAKVLPCMGDGGCIVTDNAGLAEEMRYLRNHGRNPDGSVAKWGINSRLDNMQAAFLKFFLSIYDREIIEKRRYIAKLYHERLGAISQIHLPPAPTNEVFFDVFQNFEVEFLDRDIIQKYLEKNGVSTLKQWGGKAVHEWEGLKFNKKLPFTEQVMRKSLLIPMNISLADDDVNYICDLIETFYTSARKTNSRARSNLISQVI